MVQAKVTSKGQVTIPFEVRQRLGLRPGTRIDFVWRADGGVGVEVVNSSIAALAGVLHRADRVPVTLEEMEDSIRSQATEAGAGRDDVG